MIRRQRCFGVGPGRARRLRRCARPGRRLRGHRRRPGALYSDGQSGRYLLGGTWLYRADTGDVGVAQGWWRNVAATDGWAPATIPNAYNAGDFSQASMNGYVGWYRRDFTLPAGAFASYVPKSQPALDHPLRIGQLPRDGVAERARARQPRRRLRAVGARPDGPARRRQPPDRPGRQPAHGRPTCRPGPGGGWWNYGGILREVYLRAVADRRPVAGADPDAPPCPSCAARHRGAGAGPQRDRARGRRSALTRDVRAGAARFRVGDDRATRDLDRDTRPRAIPHPQPVGARAPDAVQPRR